MWFWRRFGNNYGILGGRVIGIVLGMFRFMVRHIVAIRHVQHFYVGAKLFHQFSRQGFVFMVGSWGLGVVIFFRWRRRGWMGLGSWWVVIHDMVGRRMGAFYLHIMNWLGGGVIRSRGWWGVVGISISRLSMCWEG